MRPEEISRVSFSTAGKGGYSTAEVDSFLEKVSREFATMHKNDEDLRRRMSRMLETIREYDKEKDHIYKTLVGAQAMADTKISEANAQAEDILAQAGAQAQQLLGEKRAEADAYYYEKTHAAEESLKLLTEQIAELESKYSSSLDEYIRLANEKAAQILIKANDDAASIVAAAYDDAKKARANADEAVACATAQLKELSDKTAILKCQIISAVESIAPAMDRIQIDTVFAVPETKVELTSAKDTSMPEFNFDFGVSAPAAVPTPVVEDVAVVPNIWVDNVPTFSVPLSDEAEEEAVVNTVESASDFFSPEAEKFLDDLFDSSDEVPPSKFVYDSGDFGGDGSNE